MIAHARFLKLKGLPPMASIANAKIGIVPEQVTRVAHAQLGLIMRTLKQKTFKAIQITIVWRYEEKKVAFKPPEMA